MSYLALIREILNYSIFLLIMIAAVYSFLIYIFHKHNYWFWQGLALTSIGFASVGTFFIPIGWGDAPFLLNVTLPALLGGLFFYMATRKILYSVTDMKEKNQFKEDVSKLSLLSDDAIMIKIYNELLNNFLLETRETIGLENQKKILKEHFEYNPIIFTGSKILGEEGVELNPVVNNLNKLDESIKKEVVHKKFSELIVKLVETHSKVTSAAHSRKKLGEIYLNIQDRYEGNSILFDILRSLPEDVLVEERLGLLSRDELKTKVKERTAEMENVMNTMVDILIKIDPDGNIEMINEAFEKVLGYDEDHIIGKSIDRIIEPLSDKEGSGDIDPSEKSFVEMVKDKGTINDYELIYITSAGERIPMSVSASVTYSENGKMKYIVCMAKDIRDRKEAEDRVQFLLTLLRHDLKNKNQVVRGYLQLLKEGNLEEDMMEIVDKAIDGLKESQNLIKKVGMLKEIEKNVNINEVKLSDYVGMAVSNNKDKAEEKGLEIEKTNTEFYVYGGPLLEEMFSNLIENSIKHSNGDLITIKGRELEDRIKIIYEDDGRGIRDGLKEGLFEKGEKGKGSSGLGMGMYLVKRIVEVYDGSIEVRDSDLGGARFDITFNRFD